MDPIVGSRHGAERSGRVHDGSDSAGRRAGHPAAAAHGQHAQAHSAAWAGVPFLAHQIARLAAAGVDHIVLATCYLAEVFEPYFGDGSAHGVHLEYAVEYEPLGTGGAIRHAARRLVSAPEDPVLVCNGDILTGLDTRALIDRHREREADITLHLSRVDDPSDFGLVSTDADGCVLAFTEKPQTPEEIVTDQVNAGSYVFRRSVIDSIPAGRPVSVEHETFPGLLAAGAYLHGMVEDSYWLDLGRNSKPSCRPPPTSCAGSCTHPPCPECAASPSYCPVPRWPPTPGSPTGPSSGRAPG